MSGNAPTLIDHKQKTFCRVAAYTVDVQIDRYVFCNTSHYETFGTTMNNGILSEHAGNNAF